MMIRSVAMRRMVVMAACLALSMHLGQASDVESAAADDRTWSKTYGSPLGGGAQALAVLPDGGALVAGNHVDEDEINEVARVFRIDGGGNLLWDKTYGGTDEYGIHAIAVEPDGGALVAGYLRLDDSFLTDVWISRMDPEGNRLWNKTFKSEKWDAAANTIARLSDGGALIAGTRQYRAWVLRLDAEGSPVWEKTYGEGRDEHAEAIAVLPDGGALIAGATGAGSRTAGGDDVWVIRIDGRGNLLWDKTYGGRRKDQASALALLPDGGALVAGFTASKTGQWTDTWVIRMDANGNRLWDQTYNGHKESLKKTVWGHDDQANAIARLPDGGAIIAGYTKAKGAGWADAWIIRIDAKGNRLWDKTYGGEHEDVAHAIALLPEGGMLVAGSRDSIGAWVFRLDADGNGSNVETTDEK